MALPTTRPTRRADSRQHQYNKRTPVGLAALVGTRIEFALPGGSGAPEVRTSTKVGKTHIRFSLRTTNDAIAKARTAAVEQKLAALVEAQARKPASLSHKQVVAIAGLAHQRIMRDWEDNPPSPQILHDLRDGLAMLKLLIDRDIANKERVKSAYHEIIDHLLAEAAANVDDVTRAKIETALRAQLSRTVDVLLMRTEGDYSPDPVAPTLPSWSAEQADTAQACLTLTELGAEWSEDAKLAGRSPSTLTNFVRPLRQLAERVGHEDAHRITRDDVVKFAHHRQHVEGRSAKTVKDGDLAGLNVIFKWAVARGKMEINPAHEVPVMKPKGSAKRKQKGYSDEAAQTIIAGCMQHVGTDRQHATSKACIRWIMPLMTSTGARVAELVQLRRKDIWKDEGGVLWIKITPEPSRTKNDKERDVPLHPAIVEWGFLKYVQTIDKGWLFLNAPVDATAEEIEGKRKAAANRVGEFARRTEREEGVAACHGWRHWYTTQCRKHGVDAEKRKMIMGHAGEDVSEREYGDVAGLYDQICKLPLEKMFQFAGHGQGQ